MEFRVLGLTVEARPEASSSALLDLGGIKQQRVLAALLLAKGAVVSNDRLIDTVWGDRPPTKPNVTLRSYISHLRRVLEPGRNAGERARRIVTRAPGYAIEIEPHELDAWQFELAVASANTALADGDHARAVSLAEGGLACWTTNDLRGGVLEPFDNDVHRLDDLRRLGRRVAHEGLLAMGRHDEAVSSLDATLRLDPFDEAVRAQFMLALYRSGRQADALSVFRAGRELLLEELGLDASPELRELEHRILRNDPALDWRQIAGRLIDDGRVDDGRVDDGRVDDGRVDDGRVDGAGARRDAPTPPGREREAAELIQLIEQAVARNGGGVAIVTGEPGIGKSTVLRHSLDAASARGMVCSVGRCHDGSSDSTLFPWIAAWRPLIERLSDTELEVVVGRSAHWLSQILPEIGARLGVEASNSTDLFSLFDAIVRTLREGSQLEPVCIVLEDLHWADENSLRLLAVMADQLVDSRMLILASWRDTEVVSAEVSTLLDDLSSKSLVQFRLNGLEPDAIAQIVDLDHSDHSDHSDLDHSDLDLDHLAARTGGNPLFINELLRSRQLTGQLATSHTVRAAINSRLHRLPEGTTSSLAVGALCLDGFSERLLADVLDLDPDEVLDQLEAALAARMIEEDPDHANGFRFSHDLFAETLTDRLSGPRRARLHTRIGLSLERGNASVGQLAHHFLQGAGDEAALKGAEYAHRAALAALGLFDYDGALRLLEAGLKAVESLDDDPLLADLLLEWITVKKHTAPPPEVHEVARRAFAVARRAGDPHRMAKVVVAFEGSSGVTSSDADPTWLGYWCPPGVIIPMIEECLEKLPADDPLVPVLWTCLGYQYFGEYDDIVAVDQAFTKAVEAARRESYPPSISLALHNRHNALQRVLGVEERAVLLDEAIALADGERHPLQTVAVHRARAGLALDRRDLAGAKRELSSARRLAEEIDRASAIMNADVGEVALLLFQGHLDEVEQRIDDAFVRYERFGDVMLDQFGLQLSSLWRERNRHVEILDLLDYKIDGYPGPAFSAPKAVMLTELNRFDEAAEIVNGFSLAEQTSGGEPILQFLTQSFFAEAAANLDDKQLAERMLPSMVAAQGRIISVYDGILLLGSGSLFAARLHLVLGHLDDAERLFDDADHHHRALDAHPAQVRVSLGRADLAVRRGDRFAVEKALGQADRWTQRSNQRWLLDRWMAANPDWV